MAICTKIINQNVPISSTEFQWRTALARTPIYLTDKFLEILFLMFSCSIQSKIIIKPEPFSFLNIQLVLKRSLKRTRLALFGQATSRNQHDSQVLLQFIMGNPEYFYAGKVPLHDGLHSALELVKYFSPSVKLPEIKFRLARYGKLETVKDELLVANSTVPMFIAFSQPPINWQGLSLLSPLRWTHALATCKKLEKIRELFWQINHLYPAPQKF